jgi:hypothetical protein
MKELLFFHEIKYTLPLVPVKIGFSIAESSISFLPSDFYPSGKQSVMGLERTGWTMVVVAAFLDPSSVLFICHMTLGINIEWQLIYNDTI